MGVLTDKQRRDVHDAIREYLKLHGFGESLAAFEAEVGTKDQFQLEETVLEKKWSINIRLQQKILEVESELKRLKQELLEAQDPEYLRKKTAEGLPVTPAKFTLEGHRASVTCVAIHPKLPLVVSGSEDATIRLWDYETGEYERAFRGHLGMVNAVSYDPSGQRLASAAVDMMIKLWDFASGHCMRTLQGHNHNVSDVLFLPAGDALLSCSRDATIRLWEAHSGATRRTFSGHQEWVRTIAASPDGSLIASGSDDQTVRVWELSTGKQLQLFTEPTHVVECVQFSTAAADRVMAGHSNGAAPRQTSQVPNGGHAEVPAAGNAAPSVPKPRFAIAASRDKVVRIWDIISGALTLSLMGHDDWVRCVQVHPSGKFVLSCGDDRTIRVWDLSTGRCKKVYPDAHSHFVARISVHPTGQPVMVSCSVDKTVRVWTCR
eukprot:GGOE01044365.1.p1 GENE.GGOE01044365.1~~GGOE01044365.1.p1  ORF type:complete len:433 (-),score=134.87 GGOE01044365.1:31-1329(-)